MHPYLVSFRVPAARAAAGLSSSHARVAVRRTSTPRKAGTVHGHVAGVRAVPRVRVDFAGIGRGREVYSAVLSISGV